MTEDEKSFLLDMLKSEGWRIFEALNAKQVELYRQMATQEPTAIGQEMRTWYSGLAKGRQEALQEIKDKVS